MLPLMVLAAMAFGMAWAAVPAALQAWRGSHVVITTIMFNFIAAALLGYLLVGVLKDPGNMAPETSASGLGAHARLARAPGWVWTGRDAAEPERAAGAAGGGVWLALLEARSPATRCARWASRPKRRTTPASRRVQMMRSMMLSGALAGLVHQRDGRRAGPLMAEFVAGAGFAGIAGGADRAQPPGGHRAGVHPCSARCTRAGRAGLRDPGLQPRDGVHAAGLIVLFAGAMAQVAAPGWGGCQAGVSGRGERHG